MLVKELTITEAKRIAAKAIGAQIAASPRLSRYSDFSAVSYNDETEEFWTFVAGSDAWQRDGGVPGAIFVSVSKSDAHVLNRAEIERFYLRRAEPRG